MNVLVTGAEGLVGRHTISALQDHGYPVVGVLHGRSGQPTAIRPASGNGLAGIRADLLIEGTLDVAFDGDASPIPDSVVHLAAVVPSSFGGEEDAAAARENRDIDRYVLEFCARHRLPLVFASTSSVYGPGDGSLYSESRLADPRSRYAQAKLASENLGLEMLSAAGVPFTALRLNAPYGAGQRLKTVLQLFVERARGGLPLEYHGRGTREQDFTAATDIGRSVALALDARASGVFNISGGHPITMKALAELVCQVIPDCRSTVLPSGQPDPQEGATARFSTDKALREFGWRPQIDLRQGLERLYDGLTMGEDAGRPSF